MDEVVKSHRKCLSGSLQFAQPEAVAMRLRTIRQFSPITRNKKDLPFIH